MDVDIAKLLVANAGSILAGLIGGLIGIMSVLITRRTTRSTARLQRTDDYRREVRSAASAVLGAARKFIDAARALDVSVFWIRDTVRSTPDHEERYLACQATRAELEEKLEYFDLQVDIDELKTAAFMVSVHTSMVYHALFCINIKSEWPTYTEARLENERNDVKKYIKTLDGNALPNFKECVKKYASHTVVEENRRKRIRRAFSASSRWLVKQHRKNRPPPPPKQEPPADTSAAPAAVEHVAT